MVKSVHRCTVVANNSAYADRSLPRKHRFLYQATSARLMTAPEV